MIPRNYLLPYALESSTETKQATEPLSRRHAEPKYETGNFTCKLTNLGFGCLLKVDMKACDSQSIKHQSTSV